MYTPYMTVYFVISMQKCRIYNIYIYIYIYYRVLANPTKV